MARKKKMDDLDRSIADHKKEHPERAEAFEDGYKDFRIGIMLRQAREEAGLSQSELARRIHSKKTSISRLENHAEDVKLSTLRKVAKALGKKLELNLA